MLRIRTFLASTLAAVSMCACTQHTVRPEWNFGRYHFNYLIENGERVGISQVFDDGEFTYVQMTQASLKVTNMQVIAEPGHRRIKFMPYANLHRAKGICSSIQFIVQPSATKTGTLPAKSRSATAYRILSGKSGSKNEHAN